MLIILGILISLYSYALEPFERLNNVKILKVLPNNIIFVNRGLEDGIIRNDHIKFSRDEVGYAARAICLRSQSETSYWKVYRVPDANKFSMDLTYTIVGMADKEVPFPEADLRTQRKDYIDPELEKKKSIGADPLTLKVDLPERLSERDLIETTSLDDRKLFIEKALNQDHLARDLRKFRMSFYASPFIRQSINDGQSYRYGLRGANKGSKYRLMTQLERQQTRLKDPYTNEKVQTHTINGQVQFIIHRLSPNTSSLSLINYNSNYFGEGVGTPKNHWQIGPMGFTWHLFENRTWEYFDLSYIPLYDIRVTESINRYGDTSENKVHGLRHGFRLAIKNKINEFVSLENIFWIKPYQDLASWRITPDDQNLVNDLRLVFTLSDNFFMDYNLVYQRDKLWKKLSNLPISNTINSINLRYDIDL